MSFARAAACRPTTPDRSASKGSSASRECSASRGVSNGNVSAASDVDTQGSRAPTSCRGLFFTVCLYVSFALALFSHRDVSLTFPLLQSLESSVITGQVPLPMPAFSDPAVPSALGSIGSWADALVWMDRTLVPLLWAGGSGGAGAVLGVNRLTGGARVRQRRLRQIDCPGPEVLASSYGAWFQSTYNQSCVSADSEHSSGELFDVQARAMMDGGKALEQGLEVDSDGWYTVWLDAELEQAAVLNRINRYRNANWLSTETEELNLQTMLYNGQKAIFVVLEIDIVMERTGAFLTRASTKYLPAQVFSSTWAYVADSVFVALLLFLAVRETFAIYHAYRLRKVAEHMLRFEQLTNAAVLVMGAGFIIFFVRLSVDLTEISSAVSDFIVSSEGAESDVSESRLRRRRVFDLAFDLAGLSRFQEFMGFAYMTLIMVRMIDGFRANPRMGILTATLTAAADDLFHFLCVFVVVFSNFILGAHLLFGQSLPEWSSMSRASNTGFRALMGDFDFEAMYTVAPVSASVWFWAYMLLLFLILINMVLAIVLEAYDHVKRAAGEQSESLLETFKHAVIAVMPGRLGTVASQKVAPAERRSSVQSGASAGGLDLALAREELAALRQELRACAQAFKEAKLKGTSSETAQSFH